MSIRTIPLPARLLCSLLFRTNTGEGCTPELNEAIKMLTAEYGPIYFQSSISPFTHSQYYNKEMGKPLARCFITFAKLIDRGRLAEVKEFTWKIEKHLCNLNGNRTVNIDPGLLSLESLVLATGKNFTHRIYIRDGIFAELTLLYQKGSFLTLPWTYPDYAEPEVIAMLTELRACYAEELKQVR